MFVAVKLDQAPFRDVRVRRAMAMAGDWKELLAASPYALGHGAPNPAVPAGLTEWSIPVDQLTPLGRRLSKSTLPTVACCSRTPDIRMASRRRSRALRTVRTTSTRCR